MEPSKKNKKEVSMLARDIIHIQYTISQIHIQGNLYCTCVVLYYTRHSDGISR